MILMTVYHIILIGLEPLLGIRRQERKGTCGNIIRNVVLPLRLVVVVVEVPILTAFPCTDIGGARFFVCWCDGSPKIPFAAHILVHKHQMEDRKQKQRRKEVSE